MESKKIIRWSLTHMSGKAQTEEDGWCWKRIVNPSPTYGNRGEDEKYFGVYVPETFDGNMPDGGNVYAIKAKRADVRFVPRQQFENELTVWYAKIMSCNPDAETVWAQDVQE